jgi:hypothetical protein
VSAPSRPGCASAIAAQELAPIASDATHADLGIGIDIEEAHALGKLDVVGIARQQRAAGAIGFGDHVHRALRAQVAKHPFDVAGGRQPSLPA